MKGWSRVHTVRTVSVAGALLLCLSSCSTTDALTPQVDIPNATTQSTPVTQAEAENLASNDAVGDTPAAASLTLEMR